MPWLCAELVVDARCVDALTDALVASGAQSIDVADAAAGTPSETPVYGEPGAAPRSGWAHNRVTALFGADTDAAAAVAAALAAAQLPQQSLVAIEQLDDQDWVRLTQSQFAPQRISQRLWIVPTWHTAPDPAAINIVLDPGLAFGTGTHPTTRLCLRWLESQIRHGDDVIDFGCGSGILAIAAARFGAGSVRGVDIDEQALLAARRNAVQNQVQIDFHAAARALHEPADLVVANILANPLAVLAPMLAQLVRAGGRLALSGILVEQADEISAVYGSWFDMTVTDTEDGWVLLSGTRRP